MSSRKKIINDPVFGFITVPNQFLYNLIQHPFLQRLNRIKQLGLASFVYPGAQHTRLHHSIGAMYLMDEAINNLRFKGHEISQQEANGALACILLHDVGHGPFSHVLEHTLTNGIHHEEVSLALMETLNKELGGELDICISIFKNEYPKKFLHQLVSGQLDVDRLDYLRRDSFFTGVTEGNIGSARIIKMLDLRNDRLVVEAKGIYSIENFLMSRRLMYWQVYLHKTAVAAEKMLIKTLMRAKVLTDRGERLFASPSLSYFLENNIDKSSFDERTNEVLSHFVDLDDNDIWCALKVWANNKDTVLSILSSYLINRKLFKIEVTNEPMSAERQQKHIDKCVQKLGISEEEASYLYSCDVIYTNMYNEADDSIDILYNDGSIKDISEASDMLNIHLLSKKVEKHYFSYLKL
ncbi:HD superfamily phosphohydrolase [Dysgonomonas sp. PFB1-18]|uniref:HD domain-containing protein n=1 Tax=unclassified Dysgonomonas TaxID=2630389 RepID=UPI00247653A2|nr:MULTISPECIES: HD domain-containing protein [unclassified Dysgonomonas]MDH6310513.1 HD superfamily phosphohydrolase [Dysgonomonas sp. PF1-14]MDH6340363.1 HD superfamily phosphohydrolase [Dysgonomonas sp. PF1-16]MDH6382057.1 HD superfamily phosphohydrolase [Dysgonomonas sp. PFB1-18]MDH6399334.1 HD superfamily phosphohydrolase [Dysgonomonas sp. PF1-23]